MTTLKPFDNLLAIEVPIDAIDIELNEYGTFISFKSLGNSFLKQLIDIRHRNLKILGTATNTEIDFDVEPYVEKVLIEGEWSDYDGQIMYSHFKDYTHDGRFKLTANLSFRSLLSYNDIEIKEGYKLVILEKE